MPKSLLRYSLLFLILIAGCVTDQVSKHWATNNLKHQPTKIFVKHFIELGYTENHGMVFGINNQNNNNISQIILTIIRILLTIGLTIYLFINRHQTVLFHLPFLLILSGAIGNVLDSIRFGHVVDFIHIHLGTVLDWPFLFNLADAYVCFGMGIFLLQNFLNKENRQKALSESTVEATPVIEKGDS